MPFILLPDALKSINEGRKSRPSPGALLHSGRRPPPVIESQPFPVKGQKVYGFIIRSHGCPCGLLGHPKKDCHCTPRQVGNYLSKISGPLLDRIDVHVEVPAVHLDGVENISAHHLSEAVQYRNLDRQMWW